MKIYKREWILLLLNEAPLDRIHIMKALFLIWLRSGKHVRDFFKFEPYLYGPYSLDVYTELDNLVAEGYIFQPSYSASKADYYIIDEGRAYVNEMKHKVNPDEMKLIKNVVNEIAPLDFLSLLKKVYDEAPEFAKKSVFRGVVK